MWFIPPRARWLGIPSRPHFCFILLDLWVIVRLNVAG